MKHLPRPARTLAMPALTLLAALGGATMPAWHAGAQVQFKIAVGGGGKAEGPKAPIAKRSIDEYARILSLTDDQKSAVKDLHDGYMAVRKAAEQANETKMQAASEEARDTGDWDAMSKAAREGIEELGKKTNAADASFLSDLKAMLSEQQLGAWEKIERHRRRETGLSGQMFSGASVDLVRLVTRVQGDPGTSEFRELSEQYEVEIDRLLSDARRAEGHSDKGTDGPIDLEQLKDMQKEEGEVSRKIRDLNRDYASRLGAMMTSEKRAEFERAYQSRVFPKVYGESYAQQLLAAAKAFQDLSPEQREKLTDLRARHEADAQPLNATWAKAMEEAEADAGGSMMLEIGQMNGEGGDKLRDARKDRKALDDRTIAKLRELLSDKQRDALPAKKPSDGMGGMRIRIGGGHSMESEGDED